jgi:hypothetical protein
MQFPDSIAILACRNAGRLRQVLGEVVLQSVHFHAGLS